VGGCTNCKGKVGCDDRKGSMFRAVDDALARLYPTRTWGEPDDLARLDGGVCAHDGEALTEELAQELDAATFFRPGDDDEYCDYIYVLCMGRTPCLLQVRDFEVPVPGEASEPIRELYLRVCLSQMARVAAVQEVRFELDRDPGGAVIRERPRPGVYDAPLLHRFQRLVAILPTYEIAHLDFGEISAPPKGFGHGGYPALYGGEPHTANYLFYPQPSNTVVTTVI
jgi:hypothetical protein